MARKNNTKVNNTKVDGVQVGDGKVDGEKLNNAKVEADQGDQVPAPADRHNAGASPLDDLALSLVGGNRLMRKMVIESAVDEYVHDLVALLNDAIYVVEDLAKGFVNYYRIEADLNEKMGSIVLSSLKCMNGFNVLYHFLGKISEAQKQTDIRER